MARALISGIGLMGGSLAAALTRAGWHVHLHHRRHEVAVAAQARGFGIAVSDPAAAMRDADVAVVCTPVSTIADHVRVLAALPGRAVITDVGSVKGAICSALVDLSRTGRFVGSHPMAGSHRQGLDAADADLYRDATTVITPEAEALSAEIAEVTAAIAIVENMWHAIGSRTLRMTPDQHDRAVAEASHLPHILSALAAMGLSDASAPLAASGFRDTTRVAGGCQDLWTDILINNKDAILSAMRLSRARFDQLCAAINQDDRAAINTWLGEGRNGRKRYEQIMNGRSEGPKERDGE